MEFDLPDLPMAKCKGMETEIFFPNDYQGVLRARMICKQCPMRTQCLSTAVADADVYGVWGGTSRNERSWLRSPKGPRPQPFPAPVRRESDELPEPILALFRDEGLSIAETAERSGFPAARILRGLQFEAA